MLARSSVALIELPGLVLEFPDLIPEVPLLTPEVPLLTLESPLLIMESCPAGIIDNWVRTESRVY